MNYIKNKIQINKFKKQDFSNYIIWLILIVIISVICIFIWNFFGSYKTKVLFNSVKQYELVNSQLYTDKYIESAKKFILENNNIYGVITALELSRVFVNNNNLNDAQKILTNILRKPMNVNIQDLINIRIARIKLEQGNIDDAITYVSSIKNKLWQSMIQNILGDAFIYKGDKLSAKSSYKLGLDNSSRFIKNILILKLNNIS
ncbi:UPF0070 protein YfgM [Candidatus Providencia siddallii]|uniref:UPF0070 protein YfgM n=1 Tax=Candidatus Providencia siddallii TaxID=1715285 RepID=A0A0M6W6T1_9GAMM|nr:UPF0070 protein YfgM [Candidatus Providencia siddallii]